MSATVALREELAHVELARPCCAAAELSALLRFGGTVTLSGSDQLALSGAGLVSLSGAGLVSLSGAGLVSLSGARMGFAFTSTSGAVARRVRGHLERTAPVREGRIIMTVEVHRPTGLQRVSRYRLTLSGKVAPLLADLAIMEGQGRLVEGVALPLARSTCDVAAYVRGALMAAGTVSDPEGSAHLEVRAPGAATASGLARLLRRSGARGSRPGEHAGGWRVVVKSGAEIGALLARAGAHATFLRWDTARLHRELRGEANRAANAVRANVSRGVMASSRQVMEIEQALAVVDWSALPPDVQQAALARLANPEASLAELGALLDPPVGKATVHRRLSRVTQAAAAGASRQRTNPGPDDSPRPPGADSAGG